MSDGLIKAISFILFICIGFLLKNKFRVKEEINGIKKIILLLALPATIFIALLKIELNTSFVLLPFLVLAFNVFLYLITPALLIILGITNKSTVNTAKLLIPSLAPGLSCFPFILEFLGESYLAKAAMGDLGNKFFVLFILYLIAIQWFYKNQKSAPEPILKKLKSLAKVLLLEPVNVFIILALILVSFKITLLDLPEFLQDNLNRLSGIMTPLVLLFIGLAVSIKRKQFGQIFSLLMLKYGVSLLLIGVIVSFVNFPLKNDILLMLAFGLSACSFWPFAHISSIDAKEIDVADNKKTFNSGFALSVLALSLPISVLLILSIFMSGDTFTSASHIFTLAILIMFIGVAGPLYNWSKHGAQIKKRYSHAEK